MYNKINFIAAPVLSGVMLAMPWLGHTSFFSLVAFVPLFLVIFCSDETTPNKPFLKTLSVVLTFLIWNTVSIWWVSKATLAGAVIAIGLNTLLMSSLTEAVRLFTRKRSFATRMLLFASAWIVFEYLHHRWELACPWLSLGNAWASQTSLIQWYEFTGVLGGSIWILLVNGLATAFIQNKLKADNLHPSKTLSILLAALLLPIGISLLQFNVKKDTTDNTLRVAILQPNIDPYTEKFRPETQLAQLETLLQLAQEAFDRQPQLYVAPETALSGIWENGIDHNPQIHRIRQFLQNSAPHASFVVGATTFKRYAATDTLPAYTRHNPTQQFRYNAYNSALTVSTWLPTQIYHKEKLVAGVEKMPWISHLPFLEKLIFDLGGISGTLGNDNIQTVHVTPQGTAFAVPICYESAFGAHCNALLSSKGEFMVIITNDGWWGNTPGYKQHLNLARLRAVETRRFVVRSANTGISAIIDDRGNVVQQIPWDTAAMLVGEIERKSGRTIYARFGDWPVILAVLFLIGTLVGMWMKKKDRD
jgi:apolipoprotein N-acyltransferase